MYYIYVIYIRVLAHTYTNTFFKDFIILEQF